MFGLFLGKRERLRREASGWLARLHGPASEADRQAFERWCSDPARAEAFDRVKARYALAGQLGATEAGRYRSQLPPARRSRSRAFAIAAALASFALVSAVLLLGRPGGLSPARAETLHFATGVGEIREFSLPDGSRLTLDSATKVTVEIGEAFRRVALGQGRARFAVVPDADRSFTVSAGQTRITAGETIFDVALIGEGTTIHLIEGSASIEALGGSPVAIARLGPGEAITVSSSGDRVELQPSSRFTGMWPTGRLEFENAPLGAVIAEANRYSHLRISLADPRLSRLRVTGTFRAGDVEGLARSLAAAFDLNLEEGPSGELVLRR